MKSIWYLGGNANSYEGKLSYYGIKQVLTARSVEPLEFTYVDGQSTYLSPTVVAQINDAADLLLVGNGGFIKDEQDLGLRYNINSDNANSIEVPVVGLSIEDHNHFAGDHWTALDDFIARANLFSVATSNSLHELGQHCSSISNVTVVPDAAIFISPYTFTHSIFDTDKLKVGFNWGSNRLDTLNTLSQNIVDFYDIKLYLIEQEYESPAGVQAINRSNVFAQLDSERYSLIQLDLYNELYPPYDSSAPLLVDVCRQMDLIIGCSPQLAMMSIGQGIPFLGVGDDRYLQNLLSDAALGFHSPLVLKDIMQEFETLYGNMASCSSMMATAKSQFQYANELFVDNILSLI
jgi:hypothetical protein